MQSVAGLYRQYGGGGPTAKKVISHLTSKLTRASQHPSHIALHLYPPLHQVHQPPIAPPSTTISTTTIGPPRNEVPTLMQISPLPKLMLKRGNDLVKPN